MILLAFLGPLAAGADGLRVCPLPPARDDGGLRSMMARVDAAQDAADWAAEAFSDQAGQVLKKIAHALEDGKTGGLDKLTAEGFRTAELRPGARQELFADGGLKVFRAEAEGEAAGGLEAALAPLAAFTAQGKSPHAKFKIVGVTLDRAAGRAVTQVFLQAGGKAGQVSATWECGWSFPPGDDPAKTEPRLTGIRVSDYEEVHPAGSGEPLFIDVTVPVLGKTESWQKVLRYGLDHWFAQVDAAFQIPQGYHGVCVRDVDGDEREDVFLCQPAGIRNQMLLRQPDGTLRDAAEEAGLDFLDNTRSALLADLDNDGDADAAVTLGYKVVLFENTGKAQGRFLRRSQVDMASWTMSMCAADYDHDGRLDLYFCGYNPREDARDGDLLANPVPVHDANNGARNFLIRNEGAFQFTNVTQAAGLDVNNRKFTNAAAWEDFDNDGDMDLYCANDFGRKNLYRNDLIPGGKAQFTDIAAEAGAEDTGAGMSAAWGDYNKDGRMDLYVANMFSSAGRRIASQANFKADETAENRAGLLRFARGNTLFRNRGDGTFDDVGEPSATFFGRWAWSSLFMDLNNDSWLDLHVSNGFYTRPDPGDL